MWARSSDRPRQPGSAASHRAARRDRAGRSRGGGPRACMPGVPRRCRGSARHRSPGRSRPAAPAVPVGLRRRRRAAAVVVRRLPRRSRLTAARGRPGAWPRAGSSVHGAIAPVAARGGPRSARGLSGRLASRPHGAACRVRWPPATPHRGSTRPLRGRPEPDRAGLRGHAGPGGRADARRSGRLAQAPPGRRSPDGPSRAHVRPTDTPMTTADEVGDERRGPADGHLAQPAEEQARDPSAG